MLPQLPRLATAIGLTLVIAPAAALKSAPPTFSLTTAVIGSGSVDPASGQYKRNSVVTLTAIPASGWVFDRWEDGASGTANPTTVRISGDAHVVAHFVEEGEPPPPPPPPEPGEHEVIGYFVQWGIYQRDYFVKDIVANGAAPVLTAINYAFAGISASLECESLDPFADWEKRLDASESVDGVADTVPQPLKGNFNQLRKLKALYPQLRVLISIGGWNDSDKFSDAALEGNRATFVASCIDMFIRGNFAPGVTGAGIFDGIDVDWEYPGRCGATCNFRPEDTQNFTALLAEFRSQLDAIDPTLLLTVATPAGSYYYSQIELDQIHNSLDWINLMTYDFHGAWEGKSGPTNHHAPLYGSPHDPSGAGGAHDSVFDYLAAGVPPDKLNLGVPFYGHGWGRVDDVNDGLYQAAGRIPRGQYQRGVDDYKRLAAKGAPSFWDPLAEAQWTYDGNQFWSFDDPASVANKVDYVLSHYLGGIFFWELSGDDGSLIEAIALAFE